MHFYFPLPSIQFASKATVLGLAGEELGHDLLGKELPVTDNEGTAMRQPADGISISFIRKDAHQPLREYVLTVIVTSIIILVVVGSFLRFGFDFFFAAHVFVVLVL